MQTLAQANGLRQVNVTESNRTPNQLNNYRVLRPSPDTSIRLIFYGNRDLAVPRHDLPPASPDILTRFFRNLDDLPASVSLEGFESGTIAALGYKLCRQGYLGTFSIPRGAIVVPARSAAGKITGLWNATSGEWITRPTIHAVNLIRRSFTRTVEIHPSVISADVAAFERNCAAICLGGFGVEQLSQRIVGSSPEIVSAWEVAA